LILFGEREAPCRLGTRSGGDSHRDGRLGSRARLAGLGLADMAPVDHADHLKVHPAERGERGERGKRERERGEGGRKV
jgi:hypothetical protein